MLTATQHSQFKARIRQYLQSVSYEITDEKIDALLAYLALFIKWNKTYNLSAIRDPEAMFVKHILDSLSVIPHVKGTRFIDVGTGGGLPGMVLAICFDQRQFVLLDSAGKKTRFLENVKRELKLHNVDVQNCRVESYQPPQKFDGVISRAFASLHDMLHWCAHLVADTGKFYAMKGLTPQDEIDTLAEQYRVHSVTPLQVPDLEANRCLIELSLAQPHCKRA